MAGKICAKVYQQIRMWSESEKKESEVRGVGCDGARKRCPWGLEVLVATEDPSRRLWCDWTTAFTQLWIKTI